MKFSYRVCDFQTDLVKDVTKHVLEANQDYIEKQQILELFVL